MNCSSTELNAPDPRILKTRLDCKAIADELNPSYPHLKILPSTNPGRCVAFELMLLCTCYICSYLCAYIYFQSLAQYDGRALFVHIPPWSAHATETSLTQALSDIIKQIAKRIE